MSVITSVLQLDQRILLWSLNHRNHSSFMQAVRLVSHSGDGYAQILAIALLGVFGQIEMMYLLIWLFLVERSLYWITKNTLKRPRPPESIPSFQAVMQASDRFSFPSGHTSAACLLAFTLSPFLLTTTLYWLVPLLFLWAGAVAASRVLLGVHYPSDTLAGALLALLVVLIMS